MTKTMETKDQILELLKERERTTTELSEQLGLAKSTVSQHLQELKRMGYIEAVDNRFFKRIRHYAIKRRSQAPPISVQQFQYRMGISLLVLLVASSLMYYLYGYATASSVSVIAPLATQANTQTSTPQISENYVIGLIILGAVVVMSIAYLLKNISGLRSATGSKNRNI